VQFRDCYGCLPILHVQGVYSVRYQFFDWEEYITDMHSLYAAVNNSSILDYNPNTNEYMAHYTLQQSNPPHIDASSDLFVGHHTLNESPATIPTDADKISGHSITDLMRKILNYIRSAI